MAKKRHIKAPAPEQERELLSIIDAEDFEVAIRNKTFKFGMLTGHAQHKITDILLKKDADALQNSCKCLAAAKLNGYFAIKFLWHILWRWYYFVRQYTEDELTDAVAMIKKKVPLKAFLINTTLLIGMRETMIQMNRNEAFLIPREQSGDNDGNSAKSDNGSPDR